MVWPYSTINRDTLIAILSVAFLLSCGFKLFDHSQERLVQSGTIVDLGRVSVGQTMEKQVFINNSSSKAIEILQWAPTCRCMQVHFDQTIVQPHSEVAASVRTTAVRPLGARAANIAVQWRYAGEQFVRTDNIIAKARYISNFSLSDERLDFGNAANDQTVTRLVTLRPEKDSSKWDELEVSSDSNNLEVQVLKGADYYKIQGTLHTEKLSSGVWRGTIRIFTLLNGVRTEDELDVPVVATIEGSIRASPSVIQLSSASSQKQFFSIKIRSTAGPMSGLKFGGNLVQNPEVVMSTDGKEAVMTGFLKAPARKGAYAGRIPIQVNNDPCDVVKVSFLGFAG